MGRLRVEDWLLDGTPDWPTAFRGAWHHIGTTRMATDPGRGVVDETCRVHGIGNLYIAGCSVFPTSGWVNPTFTIVALSLRLADYLRTRLA
jgi:choline dehydrogenase-like flavoprotein